MTRDTIFADNFGILPVKLPESVKEATLKAMDEYALEEMTRLLKNIASRPIQCYSQKVRGEEKQFFLSHGFIEDLILSLKKQYKNGGK